MLELFWPALVGGIAVAVAAGPLGSLLVWRRLAYFGDSLSHAALLGVGLGLLLSAPIGIMVAVVCLLVALALSRLLARPGLASDTLLAILAYGFLSLGLVVVSQIHGQRVDLMTYLFGDLLTLEAADLPGLMAGAALVLALLAWKWRPLLAATVNEELAAVDGLPVAALRRLLLVVLALAIAGAMHVVGVLLITALLIIPAATARRLARSPEQMAVLASACGAVAVLGGLGASLQWDTPVGPSVVIAACFIFIFAGLFGKSGIRA
jgi:zinc transport system permease protein